MKRTPAKPPTDGWRDLRDGDGKLCARFDTKSMILEIGRRDLRQVARFDLREIVAELKVTAPKKD